MEVRHTFKKLAEQRVCGLAMGYDNLNVHDVLGRDPLLAVLAENADGTSESLPGGANDARRWWPKRG